MGGGKQGGVNRRGGGWKGEGAFKAAGFGYRQSLKRVKHGAFTVIGTGCEDTMGDGGWVMVGRRREGGNSTE